MINYFEMSYPLYDMPLEPDVLDTLVPGFLTEVCKCLDKEENYDEMVFLKAQGGKSPHYKSKRILICMTRISSSEISLKVSVILHDDCIIFSTSYTDKVLAVGSRITRTLNTINDFANKGF